MKKKGGGGRKFDEIEDSGSDPGSVSGSGGEESDESDAEREDERSVAMARYRWDRSSVSTFWNFRIRLIREEWLRSSFFSLGACFCCDFDRNRFWTLSSWRRGRGWGDWCNRERGRIRSFEYGRSCLVMLTEEIDQKFKS